MSTFKHKSQLLKLLLERQSVRGSVGSRSMMLSTAAALTLLLTACSDDGGGAVAADELTAKFTMLDLSFVESDFEASAGDDGNDQVTVGTPANLNLVAIAEFDDTDLRLVGEYGDGVVITNGTLYISANTLNEMMALEDPEQEMLEFIEGLSLVSGDAAVTLEYDDRDDDDGVIDVAETITVVVSFDSDTLSIIELSEDGTELRVVFGADVAGDANIVVEDLVYEMVSDVVRANFDDDSDDFFIDQNVKLLAPILLEALYDNEVLSSGSNAIFIPENGVEFELDVSSLIDPGYPIDDPFAGMFELLFGMMFALSQTTLEATYEDEFLTVSDVAGNTLVTFDGNGLDLFLLAGTNIDWGITGFDEVDADVIGTDFPVTDANIMKAFEYNSDDGDVRASVTIVSNDEAVSTMIHAYELDGASGHRQFFDLKIMQSDFIEFDDEGVGQSDVQATYIESYGWSDLMDGYLDNKEPNFDDEEDDDPILFTVGSGATIDDIVASFNDDDAGIAILRPDLDVSQLIDDLDLPAHLFIDSGYFEYTSNSEDITQLNLSASGVLIILEGENIIVNEDNDNQFLILSDAALEGEVYELWSSDDFSSSGEMLYSLDLENPYPLTASVSAASVSLNSSDGEVLNIEFADLDQPKYDESVHVFTYKFSSDLVWINGELVGLELNNLDDPTVLLELLGVDIGTLFTEPVFVETGDETGDDDDDEGIMIDLIAALQTAFSVNQITQQYIELSLVVTDENQDGLLDSSDRVAELFYASEEFTLGGGEGMSSSTIVAEGNADGYAYTAITSLGMPDDFGLFGGGEPIIEPEPVDPDYSMWPVVVDDVTYFAVDQDATQVVLAIDITEWVYVYEDIYYGGDIPDDWLRPGEGDEPEGGQGQGEDVSNVDDFSSSDYDDGYEEYDYYYRDPYVTVTYCFIDQAGQSHHMYGELYAVEYDEVGNVTAYLGDAWSTPYYFNGYPEPMYVDEEDGAGTEDVVVDIAGFESRWHEIEYIPGESLILAEHPIIWYENEDDGLEADGSTTEPASGDNDVVTAESTVFELSLDEDSLAIIWNDESEEVYTLTTVNPYFDLSQVIVDDDSDAVQYTLILSNTECGDLYADYLEVYDGYYGYYIAGGQLVDEETSLSFNNQTMWIMEEEGTVDTNDAGDEEVSADPDSMDDDYYPGYYYAEPDLQVIFSKGEATRGEIELESFTLSWPDDVMYQAGSTDSFTTPLISVWEQTLLDEEGALEIG
jgi:hypothetical protein